MMNRAGTMRMSLAGQPSTVNRRQRGSLLIDVILGMTLILSLVGVAAQYLGQQTERVKRLQIATEQDALLFAARGFVSVKLDEVREKLYTDAGSHGGEAMSVYDMDDLSEQGFLPRGFDGGVIERHYGKNMALILRAVSRNDTSTPKLTMTSAQLDPGSTGSIDPVLTDGVSSNDEMDFEAMLVTYGGTSIPRGAGGAIVSMMDSPFGGYMNSDDIASGAQGSIQVDMGVFSALSEKPSQGDLASVVALSSFDVLGDTAILDAFLRCEGLDTGGDDYQACLGDNMVYTDFIISHIDTDNDGTPDVFPALRGVTAIDCLPTGTGSVTGAPNSFQIDCSTTQMSGNLEVTGDDNILGQLETTATELSFAGDAMLERRDLGGSDINVLTSDRVEVRDLNGGQDLSEVIVSSEIVRPGNLVTKPQCPLTTLDGANAMEPRIYLSPIEYADPYGRAIVGVRAFAEDLGANWRVRLMSVVAQDVCQANFANSIPSSTITKRDFSRQLYDYLGNPNGVDNYSRYYPDHIQCSTWDSEGDPVTDRSDGYSDVYSLGQSNAVILAQTRCY